MLYTMKHYIFLIVIAFLLLLSAQTAHAQMMGFSNSSIDNTAIQSQQQEEQTGKTLLDKLNTKVITCQKLTSDNFEKIGEYFMGQAIGNTSEHISMNNMMQSMMGQQGEEQMHIAWGERGSGCNTNASLPIGMMNMMVGFNQGFNNQGQGGETTMMGYGNWNNMMEGWGGFGLGWIFMIIFWILLILGVIALMRYIAGTGNNTKGQDKTPIDILKERYAKGEITKKEFEEMKKDIG